MGHDGRPGEKGAAAAGQRIGHSSPAAPLTFPPSLGHGHSLGGSQTPTRTPGLRSQNGENKQL